MILDGVCWPLEPVSEIASEAFIERHWGSSGTPPYIKGLAETETYWGDGSYPSLLAYAK